MRLEHSSSSGVAAVPDGYPAPMYLGTSIFLIALGAILKFAITATVAGIDLQTAGVILMVVGAIGLVVSLLALSVWSDRRRDEEVVREREYRPAP